MRKLIDLLDASFGKWTVIDGPHRRSPSGKVQIFWTCKCSCGAVSQIHSNSLRRGRSNCCEKCKNVNLGLKNLKHGSARKRNETSTYQSWKHMRSRCLVRSNKDFHHYGGRGISICERWNDYANFLSDMGEKPAGLTLDRINVDDNYCPENCRWATRKEQTANRRPFKQAGRRGESSNCAKLTWNDVNRIRALQGTASQSKIAAQFSVTQTLISQIFRNKVWNLEAGE